MDIQVELQALGNKTKAAFVARYFKTGKGEYGEGDVFLGITVPVQRLVAKKYVHLSMADITQLLHSTTHEYRSTALMIVARKFAKASESERKDIYTWYLQNTAWINNWDLIDGSARDIVGMWLLDKPHERKILTSLARSKSLWERRIAIIATFAFLKKGDFADTFTISEILLHDNHDLIHKAVGWMLREVGKIDQEAEETFLKKNYKTMPRTMLRYAIERFPQAKRLWYMA
jgi:3-methyladenine DNA glycosylase AlkD